MAVGHALSHDQVPGNGEALEGHVVGADDSRAVHVLGVGTGLIKGLGEHVVQHHRHLGPGDGLGGHDVAAAALDVAGVGHGPHRVLGPVGHLAGVPEGVHALAAAGELQHPGHHDHGLLAGDGVAGPGMDPVALEHAGGAGLQHRVGVPGLVSHIGKAVVGGDLVVHDPVQDHSQLGAGDVTGGIEVAGAVPLQDAPLGPHRHGVVIPGTGGLVGLGGHGGRGAHHGTGEQQGQDLFLHANCSPCDCCPKKRGGAHCRAPPLVVFPSGISPCSAADSRRVCRKTGGILTYSFPDHKAKFRI